MEPIFSKMPDFTDNPDPEQALGEYLDKLNQEYEAFCIFLSQQ